MEASPRHVSETVLQFSLQIIGETVAKGGVNPPNVVAPLDLLLSVGYGVK